MSTHNEKLTGQQRPEKGTDMTDNAKPAFAGTCEAPCSAAEEPRQASWNEIQRAMIEEQQAEYDEYVRRCGGVPISKVPPPNKGISE